MNERRGSKWLILSSSSPRAQAGPSRATGITPRTLSNVSALAVRERMDYQAAQRERRAAVAAAGLANIGSRAISPLQDQSVTPSGKVARTARLAARERTRHSIRRRLSQSVETAGSTVGRAMQPAARVARERLTTTAGLVAHRPRTAQAAVVVAEPVD